MLSETRDAQNERLAARFDRVSAYLTACADAAETERHARWRLPADVDLTAYETRVAPLRAQVTAMLCYPPPGTPVEAAPTLERIGEDEDGAFYRVSLPLLREGLDGHGLLIIPPVIDPGKRLAVAVHGGGGTPELAAELLGPTNYNNMGRRLARRGQVVWMPACYERTTFETQDPPRNIHQILDDRARSVGTTVTAIDVYTIIRTTEVMLTSPFSRSTDAIIVGLSYGGMRALVAAAISPIFAGCVSSCFFNDRRAEMTRSAAAGVFRDWIYRDVLRIATDVEFAALICPRPLCIEVGMTDELFPVDGATRAAEQVRARYATLGIADRFLFDPFEGGHEFSGEAAFQFLDRMGL